MRSKLLRVNNLEMMSVSLSLSQSSFVKCNDEKNDLKIFKLGSKLEY